MREIKLKSERRTQLVDITQQIQQKYVDVIRGKVEDPHGWLTYVKAERASGRR